MTRQAPWAAQEEASLGQLAEESLESEDTAKEEEEHRLLTAGVKLCLSWLRHNCGEPVMMAEDKALQDERQSRRASREERVVLPLP